jgi:hypothetical protein
MAASPTWLRAQLQIEANGSGGAEQGVEIGRTGVCGACHGSGDLRDGGSGGGVNCVCRDAAMIHTKHTVCRQSHQW